MSKFENAGCNGKDVITGFQGTIVSQHNYITGCTQYGLQPKIKDDGTLPETQYFDETRLVITGEPIEIMDGDNGCDNRPRP